MTLGGAIEREATGQGTWLTANSETFWRNISQPDHVVQIYESEQEFMDSLVAFAVCGFKDGQSVVVIATSEHTLELDERLRAAGYDVFNLRLCDQYITLDARRTLYEFTINRTPDPILFRLIASNVMKRAKRSGRKVRAFGEMVAILWAQGNTEGTFCLEQLWNEYMNNESFSLFCAYPKSAFPEGSDKSLDNVCQHHTHVIEPTPNYGILQYKLSKA